MLLFSEAANEWAACCGRTQRLTAGSVDLLQIPVIVILVIPGVPHSPGSVCVGKMLLVAEVGDEQAAYCRWTVGFPASSVDLLQIPVIVILVIPGVPHSPGSVCVGKMLLVAEVGDEQAAYCRWTVGFPASSVDLLQIPVIVILVIPGVPHSPRAVCVGKMLLVAKVHHERAAYCLWTLGSPSGGVDLLQIPAIVSGIVPRVPNSSRAVQEREVLLLSEYADEGTGGRHWALGLSPGINLLQVPCVICDVIPAVPNSPS